MEPTTIPIPCIDPHAWRPLWVSIEGINGVGKTSAARAAASALGEQCLLLDELTDQTEDTLPGHVISALAANGDVCLRTGHPIVETLALLALKFHEAERFTNGYLAGFDAIIEDRGLDSVAVCQAAIVAAHYSEAEPQRLARYVLSSARSWYRLPEATILLTGDRTACAQRFAERIGRTLTPSELAVVYQAEELYLDLAVDDPDRYTVLDTSGWSSQETARAVEQTVLALITEREAAHVA